MENDLFNNISNPYDRIEELETVTEQIVEALQEGSTIMQHQGETLLQLTRHVENMSRVVRGQHTLIMDLRKQIIRLEENQ